MNFEFEIIFFSGWLIKLIIFQQVSQYKFKLPVIILIPLGLTLVEYFYYDVVFWGELFFLPIIALIIKYKEGWSWTQYFFNSFFALVVDDLFSRILGMYVKFAFNNIFYEPSFDLLGWTATIFNLPVYFIFLKVVNLDMENLKKSVKNNSLSRVINLFNFSLILYFISIYILASLPSLEYEGWISVNWDDVFYRQLLVLTYLPIFLGFLLYINYLVRNNSEDEIKKMKDEQIVSLSQYSNHMEELYKEVRSFRHDYTNLLSSFNYAIQNRDIDGIEEIYHSVFKDSDKKFKSSRYDIANLSNLDNEPLKSVVSLKMIEAQHKGINLSVEVENKISVPESIELIDLLKVVSIFLDNAIEAAVDTKHKYLSFAYFREETRIIMIIENSTKERKINTKNIFKNGYSSKDPSRGIGLANVRDIVSLNPKISLQTFSDDYIFRQEIVFD